MTETLTRPQAKEPEPPTKPTLAHVIATLPKQLETGELYSPTRRRYCAVGWMAHLLGIPDDELYTLPGASVGPAWVYDYVADHYGIGTNYQSICDANDGTPSRKRRAAVISALAKLAEGC